MLWIRSLGGGGCWWPAGRRHAGNGRWGRGAGRRRRHVRDPRGRRRIGRWRGRCAGSRRRLERQPLAIVGDVTGGIGHLGPEIDPRAGDGRAEGFLARESFRRIGRWRGQFDRLPRTAIACGILILNPQRCGDQMGVSGRVGKLDIARGIDLGLHQELRPLCIDDQSELCRAGLRVVWLAAGVEGLSREPELAILARSEAEAAFVGPALVVEVPRGSAVPGDENPHGRGWLVGRRARANGERDFQVGLPREVSWRGGSRSGCGWGRLAGWDGGRLTRRHLRGGDPRHQPECQCCRCRCGFHANCRLRLPDLPQGGPGLGIGLTMGKP